MTIKTNGSGNTEEQRPQGWPEPFDATRVDFTRQLEVIDEQLAERNDNQ